MSSLGTSWLTVYISGCGSGKQGEISESLSEFLFYFGGAGGAV